MTKKVKGITVRARFAATSFIELALVYCKASTVETLTAGSPEGAVEITIIILYSPLRVPIAIAGAAMTFTQLLTFWFQIIIGYPIFQFKGLKKALSTGFSEAFLET